mmetsp:Transcript_8524/g.27924  ORF Transcript_8524/g.27924 Transcript_8524/m.27924 type:complete len:201 (+) Transcript_8524:393-995(+)
MVFLLSVVLVAVTSRLDGESQEGRRRGDVDFEGRHLKGRRRVEDRRQRRRRELEDAPVEVERNHEIRVPRLAHKVGGDDGREGLRFARGDEGRPLNGGESRLLRIVRFESKDAQKGVGHDVVAFGYLSPFRRLDEARVDGRPLCDPRDEERTVRRRQSARRRDFGRAFGRGAFGGLDARQPRLAKVPAEAADGHFVEVGL